ncbi:putative membrane protein, partial [Lachnellula suecica]
MTKQENVEAEGLLQKPESVSSASAKSPNDKEVITWMSLPHKRQLFLLALCRLSEPLSNTCLLPYIYYLVKSIIKDGDDASAAADISRLSGLLVAAFPLAQFATSMLWGRWSDIYGRKSIITIGLLASVIANMAFGFSRSVGALFFWRILAGLGNGNTGVMRTMTAEIVKERKYQTRAFLILPLVFNSGMVAGLALGGCLADPVVNMAWLFGPNGVFNVGKNEGGVAWALKYPYALPAMSNAIALGVSLMLAVFGLKETLSGKEDGKDYGIAVGQWLIRRLTFQGRSTLESTEYTAIKLEDFPPTHTDDTVIVTLSPPPVQRPNPPFRNIWTRDVLVTLISFGLLPLHNSAFHAHLPHLPQHTHIPQSTRTPSSPSPAAWACNRRQSASGSPASAL